MPVCMVNGDDMSCYWREYRLGRYLLSYYNWVSPQAVVGKRMKKPSQTIILADTGSTLSTKSFYVFGPDAAIAENGSLEFTVYTATGLISVSVTGMSAP